jgi:membrane protease YdiL (CAAX protease family)
VLSAEQLEQQNQAAESLAQAFSTLPLAILLSISAATGEEIFFRGAFQPIFGNLLTSGFFVLLHTQYYLSIGTLLIFFVSFMFGWVRARHSTTAAIISHFVYDFILLFLLSI